MRLSAVQTLQRARWRLGRIRRLGAPNLLRLVAAWLHLLLVDVELRLLGVERTARLARPAARRSVSGMQVERARNHVRWLRLAAAHHVVQARCLHQSLALHQWLRAGGAPSKMDIGVAVVDGELRAHAWVRVGDHLVGDSAEAIRPFVPLAAARGVPWQ